MTFQVQGVPCLRRLGVVDLDFVCSTVCQTLLGLMGIWQKRLGSWSRWWNTEIQVNPTQVYEDIVGLVVELSQLEGKPLIKPDLPTHLRLK